MSTLAYKQVIEHLNSSPVIKTKIIELSTLCRYKYRKDNKPDRYFFDITLNNSGLMSASRHICYFDNKEEAEKKHRELQLKLYDQESEPFLRKIASNHYLTQKDKDKIMNLIDRFSNYKKIEEVTIL